MNLNNRPRGNGLSFYIILLVVILFSSFLMGRMGNPEEPTLSSLEKDIVSGKVESVDLNGNELHVEMKAKDGRAPQVVVKKINPLMVENYHKMFQKAVKDSQLSSFDYHQPTDFSNLFNIILLVLMIGSMAFFVWFSFSRQGGDGRTAMNFGRNRAKVNDPAKNKVSFADVAGADEEKAELQEVVDFLKHPEKYTKLGAKIPRGILLVGPPGTGKTLLAKAVAGEAAVPFFSISGSDFVEMFVGVGASRVRDLFNDAKKKTPCIVFIDEIDAVGRHRGAGLGGGHDEREQTLNQLLVEMDGFGPNEGVIVMAATNRPDILDPALLRPGRFDRRITVMPPDLKGRFEILKVHAKDKPIEANVDLREIAKITPGFTGADLANLLNEAALLAARHNKRTIQYEDISEAVFKITIGPEKKSRVITDKEKHLTAYHEAGHAIVLRQISRTQRVERVSIIPASGAGGYTAFKPNEDLYFQTRGDLIHSIMVALGGRAAEQLSQDDISTGASSDLQRCNQIAREMVTKYGMSKRLGNFVLPDNDEVFLGLDYAHAKEHSESVSSAIDEEVKSILDEAYSKTLSVLQENRDLLDKLAAVLMEKEKIEGREFEEIYKAYAANYVDAPGDSEEPYINELGEPGGRFSEPSVGAAANSPDSVAAGDDGVAETAEKSCAETVAEQEPGRKAADEASLEDEDNRH